MPGRAGSALLSAISLLVCHASTTSLRSYRISGAVAHPYSQGMRFLWKVSNPVYNRSPLSYKKSTRASPFSSRAKGFGAEGDKRDQEKSVRLMTTVELRTEIESYGIPHEDCTDRMDLEQKLTAVRRGIYREGKIKKVSGDAGGYLRRMKSSAGNSIVSPSSSQESKASSFDAVMRAQSETAQSFDDKMQDRLKEVSKKGGRVFDLLTYPCEHEIKIVGAIAMDIETQVLDIVADTTGADRDTIKTSSRTKGKWVSVSVLAPVSSSKMLYECYSRLNTEPAFRFVI